MRVDGANISAESGRNFTERYGGWILSACLHVMLFAGLLMSRQVRTALPVDRLGGTIKVTLAAPGEEIAITGAAPAAAPTPAPVEAAPEIVVEQAAQLGQLPTPKPAEAAAEEAAPAADSLAAVLKSPVTFKNVDVANVKTPEAAPVADLAAQGGGGAEPYNPRAGGSTETGPGSPDGVFAMGSSSKRGLGSGGEGTEAGSAAVKDQIQLARADLMAKKTLMAPKSLFAGRAHSEGAIRSIDLSGVDGEKAKEVLARYGIKILAAPVGGGARELVTAKPAGTEQFATRFGSGAMALFQFSSIAANRMSQLEVEALRKEGYDPDNTRVVKATFCIVGSKEGDYDLGVMEIKTEPLVLPRSRKVEKIVPGAERVADSKDGPEPERLKQLVAGSSAGVQ